MVKKESISEQEKKEAIELTENIPNSNEFDLEVLKIDIENQQDEIKELRNQELIDKANFQKTAETEKVETEKFQDFNEGIQEILQFIFRFVNNPLKKIGITPFDKAFIQDLIERFTDMLPKEAMVKIKQTLGAGVETKAGFRLMKVFKFLTFITEALFSRIDEYKEYKKVQEVDKGN